MSISKQMKDFYKVFSQHGSGDALFQIDARDVVLLIHISYRDVFLEDADWFIPEYTALANNDFFTIRQETIYNLPELSIEKAVEYLELCGAADTTNIIYLYLKNLCDLYRRRAKYYYILQKQPFPLVAQIGPRCLIEYGNCDSDLLFNWISWRKWIYDIDNRSAQETGYLFEPILSSCLGGESVSHIFSPIKRIDGNGKQTSEGRQIDCLIGDEREAYELKLRVTIAASGQGRFKEEMSFPYEAQAAGFIPVLIVFDPTPSSLLDKLKAQYVKCGGRFAIGEDAWNELTCKAGEQMGRFIAKYIKPPIIHMEEKSDALPSKIILEAQKEYVIIQNSEGVQYRIPRECVSE